jgi:hypothetical protein
VCGAICLICDVRCPAHNVINTVRYFLIDNHKNSLPIPLYALPIKQQVTDGTDLFPSHLHTLTLTLIILTHTKELTPKQTHKVTFSLISFTHTHIRMHVESTRHYRSWFSGRLCVLSLGRGRDTGNVTYCVPY